jgi:PIN domain nuclease of toxin-antitoxin system
VSDVYALDTNALIFYGFDQLNKLGKTARRIVDQFESGAVSLVVPSIALAELWTVLKGSRFRLETTLETWWKPIENGGVLPIDLTAEDVMTAASLGWAHRDPFDRLIVATTLRYGCPLLTADQAIADWGGIEVVW